VYSSTGLQARTPDCKTLPVALQSSMTQTCSVLTSFACLCRPDWLWDHLSLLSSQKVKLTIHLQIMLSQRSRISAVYVHSPHTSSSQMPCRLHHSCLNSSLFLLGRRMEDWMYRSTLLTSALVAGACRASRSCRFNPSNHHTEG
jgi:hypothetical protein